MLQPGQVIFPPQCDPSRRLACILSIAFQEGYRAPLLFLAREAEWKVEQQAILFLHHQCPKGHFVVDQEDGSILVEEDTAAWLGGRWYAEKLGKLWLQSEPPAAEGVEIELFEPAGADGRWMVLRSYIRRHDGVRCNRALDIPTATRLLEEDRGGRVPTP